MLDSQKLVGSEPVQPVRWLRLCLWGLWFCLWVDNESSMRLMKLYIHLYLGLPDLVPGKDGRFKKDGNFRAKCHRISLKKPCRNTEDPVKYGRSGNPIQLIDKSIAVHGVPLIVTSGSCLSMRLLKQCSFRWLHTLADASHTTHN